MSSLNTNLNKMALDGMKFSHSPYSQKKIGASVLLTVPLWKPGFICAFDAMTMRQESP